MAPAVPTEKVQLLELTSTRFFAAMAVFLGHFNDWLDLPPWLSRWITGGFGVSFFFVLSGFILTYVYWEHFEGGVARRGYRRYLVARFARIYPSYAMALVLITLLYLGTNVVFPGVFTFPPNAITSWLANLFALQTFAPSYLTQQAWNGPSWSISTEFGFYLACPVILAAIARYVRSTSRLLALFAATLAYAIAMQALALVLVLRFGWDQTFWLDTIASRNIFWRLPEFLTGVIAARLLYGGHLAWLQGAAARNILLVASFALVSLLNVGPWPTESTAFMVMRQFRLEVAYMLPIAGIVLALAAGPTLASPVLKRPSWVFLGDISYGIYIYHWIPWMIVSHVKAYGWNVTPTIVTGVIAATILFSAASFIWYEKPARIYLRRTIAH